MAEENIGVDEWLAELDTLQAAESQDGYLTSGEIRDRIGCGHGSVGKVLRAAKRAGRLVSARVRRESIDGIMRKVAAYRIVPCKGKRKGAR